MNFTTCLAVSPARVTATALAVAAVWLLSPEIVHAAVAFGEIGQNVAENAKGVAKGITMAGFATGAGMGVWGGIDMYNALLLSIASYFVQNILQLQMKYKNYYLLGCK